jgi:hypothetical protein
MKKLIKLNESNYIVVDNSCIERGDYYYNMSMREILYKKEKGVLFHHCKKITHSTQPLEDVFIGNTFRVNVGGFEKGYNNIKALSISEVEELVNGYDLITLSKEATKNKKFANGLHEEVVAQMYYRKGFKTHQELVKDKLFTVNDMRNMFILGGKHKTQNPDKFLEKMEEIIQSLLLKTEWDVEFVDGKIKLI